MYGARSSVVSMARDVVRHVVFVIAMGDQVPCTSSMSSACKPEEGEGEGGGLQPFVLQIG
jgi:hypothetical protein